MFCPLDEARTREVLEIAGLATGEPVAVAKPCETFWATEGATVASAGEPLEVMPLKELFGKPSFAELPLPCVMLLEELFTGTLLVRGIPVASARHAAVVL